MEENAMVEKQIQNHQNSFTNTFLFITFKFTIKNIEILLDRIHRENDIQIVTFAKTKI